MTIATSVLYMRNQKQRNGCANPVYMTQAELSAIRKTILGENPFRSYVYGILVKDSCFILGNFR